MNTSIFRGRLPSTVQLKMFGSLAAALLLPLIAGCAADMGGAPTNHDGGTGGTGGKAASGGAGGAPVTLPSCDAPTKIFVKDVLMGGCAGVLCHSGAFKPNMASAAATSGFRNTLVGENAETSVGACAGKKLIDSANPAASVLLKRLQGTECGEQMPSITFGAPGHLTQADVNCIAGWVENP